MQDFFGLLAPSHKKAIYYHTMKGIKL
ncbi:ribonuclease HIII [Bacillus sp. B14905]|nr:ribonuclease HIII [Bacillus sp. B14905]